MKRRRPRTAGAGSSTSSQSTSTDRRRGFADGFGSTFPRAAPFAKPLKARAATLDGAHEARLPRFGARPPGFGTFLPRRGTFLPGCGPKLAQFGAMRRSCAAALDGRGARLSAQRVGEGAATEASPKQAA